MMMIGALLWTPVLVLLAFGGVATAWAYTTGGVRGRLDAVFWLPLGLLAWPSIVLGRICVEYYLDRSDQMALAYLITLAVTAAATLWAAWARRSARRAARGPRADARPAPGPGAAAPP